MTNSVKKTALGYELHWAMQKTYTGKIFVFDKISNTDMIFHKHKNKSFFVNSGKFKIRFVDLSNGDFKETSLDEGGTIDIPAFTPHQICCTTSNGSINEVSDSNNEEDIYILLQEKFIQ